MNKSTWNAFLSSLPADHQELAIKLMERIQAILNSDRTHLLDEMQKTHRRHDSNAARINDLAVRLDIYEQQRADDVQAELERYAREQLPPDERDRLIAILHDLVVRVKQMEDKERQSGEP